MLADWFSNVYLQSMINCNNAAVASEKQAKSIKQNLCTRNLN